jgi:transcriptional regulator with XRE-family HTH domain
VRKQRQSTLESERRHGRSPVREDTMGNERTDFTDEHVRKLFLDRFPTLLRWARTDAGLSTRELARRAKIDPTYLSRVERSLSPPPTWAKIGAIAAQVPLSELAKVANQVGGRWLGNSVLQSALDLEQAISSLPSGTLEDYQWRSAMQTRLERCLTLVRAGESVLAEKADVVGKAASELSSVKKRTRRRTGD